MAEVVPIVRVHSGCVTGDIFHSLRCDCYAQLQLSLETIIESELGIIIYLPHHEGRGIGLVNKIKAYAEQDRGLDTVDANLSIGAPIDARDYELPAKILKDLGYEKIRLMTNNPLKVEALERHGIQVWTSVGPLRRRRNTTSAISTPSAIACPTICEATGNCRVEAACQSGVGSVKPPSRTSRANRPSLATS